MCKKKCDDDFDFLLRRAESRFLAAKAAFENACREKHEAEAAIKSCISRDLFAEMDKLEAEIQQAIGPDVAAGQLRLLTVRRAVARHLHVKALVIVIACICAGSVNLLTT